MDNKAPEMLDQAIPGTKTVQPYGAGVQQAGQAGQEYYCDICADPRGLESVPRGNPLPGEAEVAASA